ncbi:hypothetical protein Lal_00012756 [Lupinus albus]|nr:hypothetical protein Lal_00012756 [Lupinus albus]
MRQMWNFSDDHQPLPYTIMITTTLEHFRVSTTRESEILLDARDNIPCEDKGYFFEKQRGEERFEELSTLRVKEETEEESWKPRLSERFSPERERITWDGEILGYTRGFSPERELSRLGEK